MMRLLIVIVLILNMCSSTVSTKGRNKVCWDEGKPLTWKDFKGNVPRNTNSVAITYISFHYEILSKESILAINCMIKDKSWVRKEKQLPRILVHEQYHFHISEIFARKMRREMAKIKEPSTKNVQDVFDEWVKKHHVEQALYDKETSHSKIDSEQIRWQEKIDKELKDLEAYKDPIVRLDA